MINWLGVHWYTDHSIESLKPGSRVFISLHKSCSTWMCMMVSEESQCSSPAPWCNYKEQKRMWSTNLQAEPVMCKFSFSKEHLRSGRSAFKTCKNLISISSHLLKSANCSKMWKLDGKCRENVLSFLASPFCTFVSSAWRKCNWTVSFTWI